MGATVGCEPSCVNEDLIVVKNPSKVSRGTQAPRGHSTDEDGKTASSAHDYGNSVAEDEAMVAAPAVGSKAGSEAFSTLPLASKGAGTDDKAEGEAEPPCSPETGGGGAFGSQSSGLHTLLQEDSPREEQDYGGTFGHAEAASHELVSAKSLADGSPEPLASPLGTLELPKQRAGSGLAEEEEAALAEADRERSGSNHTIEKEPSIISGGTILPDDEADSLRAEAAALGVPPHGSTETAFSFAPSAVSQLRAPSDELAFAAAPGGGRAAPSGGREEAWQQLGGSLAAAAERQARPSAHNWGGLGAQNPQEGTGSSMSQVVQGMRSSGASGATAAAARRQAAENRLAMLSAQGDAGSLVDAKMKVKEWQWQLKMEIKSLEREIKKVKSDEIKLHKQMQAEGQKGNTHHVQQLARTIVRSRRTTKQLETTKVSMNDLNLQLTTCAAAMSMKHAMRASADAMQGMNGIASLEELASAVEQLQAERQRGIAIEDTMQDAFRDEEEEAEAALEVQKLLEEFELDRMGLLENMGPAGTRAPVSPGTLAARQAMSSSAGKP